MPLFALIAEVLGYPSSSMMKKLDRVAAMYCTCCAVGLSGLCLRVLGRINAIITEVSNRMKFNPMP